MFNTAVEAQAAFKALSNDDQHAAWEKFSLDVDEGMAGWNPYYLYLNPLYWDGSSPFPEEDAAAEAAYRAAAMEMLSDVDHWNDASILAQDPSENAFWDRLHTANELDSCGQNDWAPRATPGMFLAGVNGRHSYSTKLGRPFAGSNRSRKKSWRCST